MASEPRVYKLYKLTPTNEKSTYRTDHWTNDLPDGREVRFGVTTYFQRGAFEVELSDAERVEILGKKHVVIDDYAVRPCEELYGDEFDRSQELMGGPWSAADLKYINRMIYCPHDEEYSGDPDDYVVDDEVLIYNDWLAGTTYGIYGGCELEDISG